jgi:RES domain-containing protein
VRYSGPLFRAINPIHAHAPLSGRGAELYGGRFNRKGTPALYTSLSVVTAIKEANQVGSLQPTTLVSYEAEIEKVFDCRDDAALHAHGIDEAMLSASDWRDRMKVAGEAPTQAFAARLMTDGFDAMLARSFARGATDDDFNLVLWRWSDREPSRLTLIDDEGRLRR